MPPALLVVADFEMINAEANMLVIAIGLMEQRQEPGAYPATLRVLPKEVYESFPKDVYTDEDYLYRLDGDGFLLYSVGGNGIDDGGDPELDIVCWFAK